MVLAETLASIGANLCLDDPAVRISTYEARVVDGIVEIGPRRVT